MTNANPESPDARTPSNFLRDMIAEDVRTKKYGDAVIQTRFPPEPNGYLHIGHAKAICIDFGLADEFGGKTNLRFDDTNPEKEEQEYVDSIMADVRWLGFDWERLCYASDYFPQLYEWALQLVKAGKAYVDDLSADEIRQHRGTLTEPGKDSPYRNRTIEENLDLFTRMKAGEFPDGTRVLRAKIDMASPNLNLRDPVMYRILHASHQRTGDKWCIYPMYDYAHGQSDSIERVTHSMCTLEFTDHQPIYRWYIEQLGIFPSNQTEFDRLNITYTMLSKRKLLQLVNEKRVSGWDDPRMPTLCGLRRRGFTPKPSAPLSPPAASRAPTAAPTSKCSSTSRGTTSTGEPAAPWPSSILSSWSSTTTPPTRSSSSMLPTTPKTPPPATVRSLSHKRFTSSKTTSAKFLRPSTTACLQGKKCACATPIS
jgi:glutaminyl-tRNA synthetase